MPLLDQRYTVRLPLPYLIVRARDTVVQAPVYLSGQLQTPSSATLGVYDASNTAIVAAGTAATISASIPSYTVLGTTTTSLTLEQDWRVDWVITMADGTVLLPRNDAALVRAGLWPAITDADVIRRVPSLDPSSANAVSAATTYQGHLDEAWTSIQRRLIRAGNRPNLVLNPSALAEPHLYLTLALVFEDLATRLDPGHTERASMYRSEYEHAWDELVLEYAPDDQEQADSRRRPARPTVWLCSR